MPFTPEQKAHLNRVIEQAMETFKQIREESRRTPYWTIRFHKQHPEKRPRKLFAETHT